MFFEDAKSSEFNQYYKFDRSFSGRVFSGFIFHLSYRHFRKAFAFLLRIAIFYNNFGFVFPKFSLDLPFL